LYSQDITQRLLAPLKLYEQNRNDNPGRNKASQRLHDFEAGREEMSDRAVLNLTDPDSFSIEVDDSLDPFIVAKYKDSNSTLVLRSGFNEDSDLDAAIAYHELVHAYQDQQLKRRVMKGESQALLEYQNRRANTVDADKRSIIADEEQAYIMQTYVLNILTDGRLQHDVASGSLSSDDYMNLLGAQSNDRPVLEHFINVAEIMYSSGTTIDNNTEVFSQFMTDYHRRAGRSPYEISPSGELVPIP